MKSVKYVVLTGAVLTLGATLLAGCGSSGPDPKVVSQGKEAFAQTCAACHGSNGEGANGNRVATLNNQNFLAIADDEYIMNTIRNGRATGGMPPFSPEVLPDEKAKAIIAYIKAWKKEGTKTVALSKDKIGGDAQKGEKIFKASCSACHGDYGEGASGPSLVDPGFLKSASDDFILKTIETGREGTNMKAYPPSQDNKDVVAYLRSKQK